MFVLSLVFFFKTITTTTTTTVEELKEQEEALQSYLNVLEINTTAIKAAADEKEPMIGVCSRAPILHDRNVDFLKIEVSLSFLPLLFSIFIQK